MMNHDYDYDFSTCIELKRVPKNIWDCDIDKLKNAESIFLESCETISRFMSTQYFELTASKCEDESLCDAVKRQKEYWSKDIPDAMRELISTLMEYLSLEPKQNKRLFMLNLSKYFCKDPIKFLQLSGKSFVPFNLLEELLDQFCRNANCEIRVNKIPDIAYAVVPKLDTILETEVEVMNNGIC